MGIGGTEMWKVGEKVRAARKSQDPYARKVDPVTAGVYVAMMVSQCDLLIEQGHCYSEVANESIIEAVDSLNPTWTSRGFLTWWTIAATRRASVRAAGLRAMTTSSNKTPSRFCTQSRTLRWLRRLSRIRSTAFCRNARSTARVLILRLLEH